MILKMSKASIIGPQRLLPEVMACIYEAGVLHIETTPEHIKDTPYIKRLSLPPEQKNEMMELERVTGLAKKTIDTLTPLFVKLPPVDDRHGEAGIHEAKRIIEEISLSVDNLGQEISGLGHQLSLYARYEKILNALSPLIAMMPESPFKDYTGITLYKREAPITALEEALQRMTEGRYELFKRDIDSEIMACVIAYPKEFGPRIKKLFQEENISELRMPADLADMPMMESFKVISEKRAVLPLQINALEKRLQRLAFERYGELVQCHRIVEERLMQMEVSSDLYGTKDTFFLSGWIPEEALSKFTKDIKNRFHDRVILGRVPPTDQERDRIPVVLDNPKFLRPFEVLTRFLSLPKYGTLDPTPLLAIFFPLFFGLILGDIGYGAILLLSSLWLRWRWEDHELLHNIGSIFMTSSLAAMIFGIIFGEFFGTLGESIGIYPYINRSQTLIPLLILSVVIGGLHISLGLFIGVIIAMKRREGREAVTKVFKLLFVFSLFTAAASFYGILPAEWGYVFVLSGSGIILALIFLEKWIAPFDALKLIVNVLSYARIMGFGAASVFLASIANRLATMPESIILGILLGIFFHLINMIIGVYAPAIQTLRLHYVEFFDKFFYPGGIEYKPFGKGERW